MQRKRLSLTVDAENWDEIKRRTIEAVRIAQQT
jgi:hypothetical protein